MIDLQRPAADKPKAEGATGAMAVRMNSSFHHLRYVLLVCSGLAMGLMLFMRLSVTVALIGMVNHTQIFINEHPNATAAEVAANFQPGYSETGEFDWTHEMQETIITCYMVSVARHVTGRLSSSAHTKLNSPPFLAISCLSERTTCR